MKHLMFFLMILAWLISAFLAVRLLASDRGAMKKAGGCLLLMVPFFGPFLYLFVVEPPPPKDSSMRASGPRGDFAQKWLVISPVLKEALRARREKEEE